jgi:flagellar basal-body rod protein FlgF
MLVKYLNNIQQPIVGTLHALSRRYQFNSQSFLNVLCMDNGVYIALSRQLALFRDMELTAGNIANANTTGYQSSHLMFTSFLVDDAKGSKMNFAHDISNYRNTDKGSFQVTNNPLDIAIEGKGYFAVETPLGVRYTRAGNLQVDGNNILVTTEGYPVLDQNNQRIVFDETGGAVTIGSAGNISIEGQELGTINVVEFENQQLLERVGDRLFATDATPTISDSSTVLQGVLESSNVQSVRELTHMIDVSRSVSSTAKLIEVMYDLQRKNASAWTRQA